MWIRMNYYTDPEVIHTNPQGCRSWSRPFWLKPEPFFWSGSGSYSYSTVNILFLRDPKYDYDYDYDV